MQNLTALPVLRVYEVARELAEETGQPLVVCLHLLAKDATTNPEAAGPALILRPDSSWGINTANRVKETYTPRGFVHSWQFDPPQLTRNVLKTQRTPWTLEHSVLANYRTPPKTVTEPKGLERWLAAEGVTVRRDDFQRWAVANDYPLPAFWFGEQTADVPQQPKKTRGKTDAMAAEIDEILRRGTPAILEEVWRELVKRCDTKGSCCLNVEETDRGPVIVWRGHGNRLKRFTKRALRERLTR